MPGKYSKFKVGMTSFSEEPDYQDRVNSKKQEIRDQIIASKTQLNAAAFGKFLVAARLEKKKLEKLIKDENLIIAAMEQEIVTFLEDQSMSSVKMDNGISLSIKDDVYCNVSNKILFYDWIKDTKQEDLFSVHYQTMASITKNALIEGKDIPPGISTYFKQSIQVRGVKDLEQAE